MIKENTIIYDIITPLKDLVEIIKKENNSEKNEKEKKAGDKYGRH